MPLSLVFFLPVLHAQPVPLTALDYFEIQQLANRYAQAIDTCSNNGYDYADLFTADGLFIDNFTEELQGPRISPCEGP
jgi:2,4-dienoyl-CoA reductase-like NADH-dependent reductase (Old Yellow Enzyme family)